MSERRSVQPEWCRERLTLQQQSVLFCAVRGPDGIAKTHPCKDVQRAYRGTVLVAARYGRTLRWGEAADSFMGLADLADDARWAEVVDRFYETVDDLPHHFLMHLLHAAEIIAYRHPDGRFRDAWWLFYRAGCDSLHLPPESREAMDARLSDWNRAEWDAAPAAQGGDE